LQTAGVPKAQKTNKGNESKQQRRKTGAHPALSSIADVFGVLVSAKLLLGRRAGENRRAKGWLPLPKVTNTTQKSPAGRFRLPI